MQITTLDHIPGQAWEEMGAPLFSEQVQAVNAAKDLVGGIKAMFGGAVRAYSQEYQRARSAALADLTAQGAAWGGGGPAGPAGGLPTLRQRRHGVHRRHRLCHPGTGGPAGVTEALEGKRRAVVP